MKTKMNNTARTILSVVVLIAAFIIALNILKVAIKILLPVAIIVIAGYIAYKFITGKRL